MGVGLHRTLTTPSGRVWYTAQTGQAARERWVKECAQPAQQVLGSAVRIKFGAGDTRLVVPDTLSEFRPMPPTADYLHGEQSDLVEIDEAWAHTEADGAALLQAVVPTMATRETIGRGPQLWYMSTMGTAASTWWHNKLADAIENRPPGVAVIDYGLAEGADPTDLKAVAAAHPAFGEPITMKTLMDAAATMSPSEFARGYGNVATTATSTILTAEQLASATTDRPLDDGPISLGVAVSWLRDTAAIAVAGRIDGVPAVEIIEARPGRSWVAEAVAAIARQHRPVAVSIDAHGPAGPVAEQLAAVPALADFLHSADSGDLVTGTEIFLAAMETSPPGVLIRRDGDLAAEIAGAQLRSIGDRGRVLSRKRSLTGVARFEAALLALRGITSTSRPTPAPVVWSP